MRIKRIHVKNFRSILDEHIDCDSLTALVGRNGSGKSSFLNALEIFYEPSGKVSIEDFFSEDATNNIEIAVTFTALMPNAKELFAHYVENDDLTVVRVFSDPQIGKSGSYHGTRLQNPDFLGVRKADGKKEKNQEIQRAKGE